MELDVVFVNEESGRPLDTVLRGVTPEQLPGLFDWIQFAFMGKKFQVVKRTWLPGVTPVSVVGWSTLQLTVRGEA